MFLTRAYVVCDKCGKKVELPPFNKKMRKPWTYFLVHDVLNDQDVRRKDHVIFRDTCLCPECVNDIFPKNFDDLQHGLKSVTIEN